jgi:hypothetical protein
VGQRAKSGRLAANSNDHDGPAAGWRGDKLGSGAVQRRPVPLSN